MNRRLLNKKICVYNGRYFLILNTNAKFKGFKLGGFSLTRRSAIHKGKKRQIKKIIKLKK